MNIDHDWEKAFSQGLDDGPDPDEHYVVMNEATNESFAEYVYGPLDDEKRDHLGLWRIGTYVTTKGMWDIVLDDSIEDGMWALRSGRVSD